jgi:hypothetical protein
VAILAILVGDALTRCKKKKKKKKRKIIVHPSPPRLKLATIFNSTIKISIFSIDSSKFQFLSIQALLIIFFFSKMPSIVIPAKSGWSLAKSSKPSSSTSLSS